MGVIDLCPLLSNVKLTYNLLDINGANIAFTSHRLTRSSATEILRLTGTPEYEALVRLDGSPLGPGLPKQLVKAATWDDWTEEDEEDIRLIDFGEAFVCGNLPSKLAQPNGLEAPETIFTSTFDYRVDLWRIGCTVQLTNLNLTKRY
jgi:hypothetical protein